MGRPSSLCPPFLSCLLQSVIPLTLSSPSPSPLFQKLPVLVVPPPRQGSVRSCERGGLVCADESGSCGSQGEKSTRQSLFSARTSLHTINPVLGDADSFCLLPCPQPKTPPSVLAVVWAGGPSLVPGEKKSLFNHPVNSDNISLVGGALGVSTELCRAPVSGHLGMMAAGTA